MEEIIKLYKVTVSDPTTGSRLSRSVLATSPKMAESMIPSGDNDVVTVMESGELETQLTLKTHPTSPNIKDQRSFFNGMSRALSLNPDLVRGLELSIPGINNHFFRLTVAQVIEDLREHGEDVQTAVGRFHGVLSNDKIAMLEAGAASGELGNVFKRISQNVEKQSGVMKKVINALIYPCIVLIMGVLAVLVLSFTLFKQMKGMFAAFGAKLPFISQMFMDMTDFMSAYWWIVLPVMIIIPTLIGRHSKWIYQQEWMQAIIDKPKYLRVLHWKVNMAQCLSGLSLLLNANVPIQKALTLTAAITEHIQIRKFFEELEKGVMAGMTVDEATQRNAQYLKDEAMTFLSQIKLGSQTGNLEDVVSKMAEVYNEEVDEQVGLLSQFIEPIVLMVLGGFVGLVVLSVYLPMVTLYQAIL